MVEMGETLEKKYEHPFLAFGIDLAFFHVLGLVLQVYLTPVFVLSKNVWILSLIADIVLVIYHAHWKNRVSLASPGEKWTGVILVKETKFWSLPNGLYQMAGSFSCLLLLLATMGDLVVVEMMPFGKDLRLTGIALSLWQFLLFSNPSRKYWYLGFAATSGLMAFLTATRFPLGKNLNYDVGIFIVLGLHAICIILLIVGFLALLMQKSTNEDRTLVRRTGFQRILGYVTILIIFSGIVLLIFSKNQTHYDDLLR